jgi:hypothetical protein
MAFEAIKYHSMYALLMHTVNAIIDASNLASRRFHAHIAASTTPEWGAAMKPRPARD